MLPEARPVGGLSRVGGRALLVLPLALSLSSPAPAATDLRILPAYFSGDYGSGIQTEIAYLPLILVAGSERQEFRATIPFISISSAQPVTFTGGQIVPGRSGKGGLTGSTTQAGLGDVIVQEQVFLLEGGTVRPWVSVIGWLKLPTADKTKGLGTGEADYGPGAAIIQPIGPKMNLMVDARYITHGTPSGSTVNYQRTRWLDAGIQLKPSGRTALNFFYDDRQSVLPGTEDLRDVSVGLDRRLSAEAVFRAAYYYGLSKTAEDYGFYAGFSFAAGR